ncbi:MULTISPECIES: LafD [Vibrio]|uniref:LafD n=1 Tax=Vibrio TaxID=662 RepID=UPI000C16F978|nr:MULTISPECIES: LafD [Vibrio]NAW70633.1 LafD [Vibrio sp. V28_P6S34P95]NAX05098.1 LafD [Vibrio sp. V30_P3S12P165]NAX35555.1 LafD [Vibrio sp. V29_P1S30P107]NAX38924.1 LafD [Vibrio sp. V27_P1S3P104]NAX40092.1 LafD [Vibrio sp. V26_P1S5P106]
MANKHNLLSSYLLQLAQRIDAAQKASDWEALHHYDAKVRTLLSTQRSALSDPELGAEWQRLKAAHMAAFTALNVATKQLKQDMLMLDAQQERAMAYQLSMPMEIIE